jgi:receptor-type tyrosine-protein phosphatase gamma
MLKQLKAKGELNLIAYLKHIRSQRNYLVQTEEQYIFVHDALAEAVACGETNIHRAYLAKYIDSLQSSFTTDENSVPWQLIDRQFKLATAFQPQEIQYAAALRPCNQHKNQSFDYLPMEASRVATSPRAGVDGSDYINASWLPGFNRPGEFILAQHPMQQTVVDFWQMIWDHGARTIVVLSPVQQQVRLSRTVHFMQAHLTFEMCTCRSLGSPGRDPREAV